MSPYAHITGWGMAVPEKVMTNDDLALIVDTNDGWIQARTGIRERRIASDQQTSASLAYQASLQALEIARVNPGDLDLIIVATSSPEYIFPATACILQDRLGAKNAAAFDLLAACSGFIYGLNIASQTIRAGANKNVLVVGAETLSKFVNWKDRGTCILFGDGAGAFLLQANQQRAGVLSTVMHADGSGADLLILPGGGSGMPASCETVENGMHTIHMNGREVFRFASRVMVQATEEALRGAELGVEDINLVIPHQANKRIIQAAIRGLTIPEERCYMNLERYGNTSTASIPIATCEAIKEGRLNPGDKVVFVGFGAGLTWAAAVATWSGPLPGSSRVLPFRYRVYARMRSIIQRLLRRIDALIWGRHNPYI